MTRVCSNNKSKCFSVGLLLNEKSGVAFRSLVLTRMSGLESREA